MVGGLSGGDFIRACSMEHRSLIWGLVNQRWPDGISSLEEKLSSDNVTCGRGWCASSRSSSRSSTLRGTHWSWIGIACKGFISCGGWQPPAERWNIIRHLDSHKLIVIAAIWKNHNIAAAITSLLAASGYVIDVKSWERVECVIWSQIDYYQVSRVHNTLVQLLLLFLIPSNSKQIDVPYCPILITVAIEHYFWNFWSRQNKYMDKTQKIIMHRLYRAGTQGRDVFSVCTEHIGERSPVFCTLCSWTQSTGT